MLLLAKGIRKQFHGVWALDGVDFGVDAGEVHGLVGENGAGKSTLIKILTGVYRMDEGEILWEGTPLLVNSPEDAAAAGIRVIHQDHVLIPGFTGVENIWLGMQYPKKHGKIDWKTMRRKAMECAEGLGMDYMDLDKTAARMTPPEKTCVEIVRAMMQKCRLLILDEPTASLTERESELLFAIIGRLKKEGTAVVYVSHRMDEIFRLTDRITVLKNGKLSGTVKTSETGRKELLNMMTDEWKSTGEKAASLQMGEPALEAAHIKSADGKVLDASLTVHHGEILGLFGLGGSGRTELLETIYGYRRGAGGEVKLEGKLYAPRSPQESIRKGLCLICEDRRGKSLIGSLGIRDNVLLSNIDDYARRGVLDAKKEAADVQEKVDALQIRQRGLRQQVRELSGGNQQKVVLARALMGKPSIWLCDEPTQAVDVRTRAEIHSLLREEAAKGAAVLLVTSDLKEMLEIADRILIISRGRTLQVLENHDLTAKQVLAKCYRGTEEKNEN